MNYEETSCFLLPNKIATSFKERVFIIKTTSFSRYLVRTYEIQVKEAQEKPPACSMGKVSLKRSSISWTSIKTVNHSDNPNRTEIGQRQGESVRYLSVTRNKSPFAKANQKKSFNGRPPRHLQTLRKSHRSQGALHCQHVHRISIFHLCLSLFPSLYPDTVPFSINEAS